MLLIRFKEFLYNGKIGNLEITIHAVEKRPLCQDCKIIELCLVLTLTSVQTLSKLLYLSHSQKPLARIVKVLKVLVAQSCLTLCNPMDWSPPGSVHGILQARILEWIAIPFTRGSFPSRDQTQALCTGGRFFTI